MFKKIAGYLVGVRKELSKLSLTTQPEVIECIWIVLGFTVTFGITVFAVDRLLSLGLQQLL